MPAMLYKLMRDTRGATAVEYAVLIACLFLAFAVGAGTFGEALANLWSNNSRTIGSGFAG